MLAASKEYKGPDKLAIYSNSVAYIALLSYCSFNRPSLTIISDRDSHAGLGLVLDQRLRASICVSNDH